MVAGLLLPSPAPPASIIIRLADPVLLGRGRSPRDRTGADNIGWPLTLELGGGAFALRPSLEACTSSGGRRGP